MSSHIHTLNAAVIKIKALSAKADEISADGNFSDTCTSSIYSGNGETPNIFTGGTTVTSITDIRWSKYSYISYESLLYSPYSMGAEGIFSIRN